MRLMALGILLVSLVIAPLSALALTIHVPGDQPTIQAGIDAAGPGDTVLVACDTYTWTEEGTGNEYGLIRMKSDVTLRSATGEPSCVTIDGEREGRVLYCQNVDRSSIEGFTIKGGDLGEWYYDGGGLYCVNSSLTITNCIFKENFSFNPGGGAACARSSDTFDNCLFHDNWAGGLHCTSLSSNFVTNCTFTGNTGMGMYCSDTSSTTIGNCTFSENTFGGMWCAYFACPTIAYCTFADNSHYEYGGGLTCYQACSPTLINCTFCGNSGNAGGVYCLHSSPNLYHTIIAFNTDGGAVGCVGDPVPTLVCCDVYGNVGGNWEGCIAGQYGINGNFSEDPLFCMCPGIEYHLHVSSPCVNGHGCGQIGAYGVGCGGPTRTVATTWGGVKSLYR